MAYDFKKIEEKWQKYWEKNQTFKVTEDTTKKDKKYYVLEMFPYPSGRLHMGHIRNYTIADVIARKKRMDGFYVMHPIGWDSFGLPAENAAIQYKRDPEEWTLSNIENMQSQLKKVGFSYDWDREVTTCKPDYYKWNQWLFLKFFEKGLVYRKKSTVNWCPKCNTVLANEQVEQGLCWRCDSTVIQKDLEQWFFKITDYKEQLLDDHKHLEGKWADRILAMQKHWIGKSEGSIINFKFENNNKSLSVFTTRPDTLFGVTYVVIAPEHEFVDEIIENSKNKTEIKKFVDEIKSQSAMQRQTLEKQGIATDAFVIHPITNEKVPVWIGNYVLGGYGTGAVMAVPAHDQRDYEFAKKYNLPIKFVIKPKDDSKISDDKAFEDLGILYNSQNFDGISSEDAKKNITEYLEKTNSGSFQEQYRIKDWLISRQRYWGTPIPIVYCEKCGTVGVAEKDLPVVLPKNVEFSGAGDSPLKKIEGFVNTTCPKCGGKATRETDTMDTFVDSSWYFLRYCDPKNQDLPFSKDNVNYWMPVDQYVGGAEHACMHLLYSRFFEKVLVDMGLIDKEKIEPFVNLLNQGMVIKDGAKMSKSKGNIVDPDEMLKQYGADAMRLFVLFAAPPDKDLDWNNDGVEGASRFLSRFIRITEDTILMKNTNNAFDKEIEQMMHATIKKITLDINNFSYNTAVATVMEAINFLYKKKDANQTQLLEFIKNQTIILHPFIPHITEEIWEKLGNNNSLTSEKWPSFDEEKTKKSEIEFILQINGKVRAKFMANIDATEDEIEKIIAVDQKAQEALKDKTIIKKIFVKNKLLNIVCK